jgi:hypothetical protein
MQVLYQQSITAEVIQCIHVLELLRVYTYMLLIRQLVRKRASCVYCTNAGHDDVAKHTQVSYCCLLYRAHVLAVLTCIVSLAYCLMMLSITELGFCCCYCVRVQTITASTENSHVSTTFKVQDCELAAVCTCMLHFNYTRTSQSTYTLCTHHNSTEPPHDTALLLCYNSCSTQRRMLHS